MRAEQRRRRERVRLGHQRGPDGECGAAQPRGVAPMQTQAIKHDLAGQQAEPPVLLGQRARNRAGRFGGHRAYQRPRRIDRLQFDQCAFPGWGDEQGAQLGDLRQTRAACGQP